MIYLNEAKLTDLGAIKELTHIYGKDPVTEAHFNHRDIAIQAREEEGRLVGFIWAGLMAKNTIAYVGDLFVHPDVKNRKVGFKLCAMMLCKLLEKGVQTSIGFIEQNQYHDRSAINCLKTSMGSTGIPCTMLYSDRERALKTLEELKSLGMV